jgi:hypothetical protein
MVIQKYKNIFIKPKRRKIMTKKRFVQALVPMMIVVMMAVAACANNEQNGREKKQGPPAEAFKACEGKAVGDSVSFAGRGGEALKATCQTIDEKLVAVPEGHRPR